MREGLPWTLKLIRIHRFPEGKKLILSLCFLGSLCGLGYLTNGLSLPVLPKVKGTAKGLNFHV